ncbi:MAG: hypothetical protein IKG23_04140 [Clostridia bacterium]|nr:hypothetical protein [Clostridia bacterium]
MASITALPAVKLFFMAVAKISAASGFRAGRASRAEGRPSGRHRRHDRRKESDQQIISTAM